MKVDLAIIGSGYGGTLLATIARQLGYSVLLLERSRHPRFAIGESSTPLANLLLEELAREYDIPELRPFTKWGLWQRERPDVACGLKRGFSFFHHEFGQPFVHDADRSQELLVAASPFDDAADTHWFRADFDAALARIAANRRAELWERTEVLAVASAGKEWVVNCRREGIETSVKAGFVVDASGPRGCLHRLWRLPETPFRSLIPTRTLFSHFQGVRRLDWFQEEHPPFPIDDAAVHHVFEGGWIWVLRFNNGIASAGAALSRDLADELRIEQGAAGWERLLGRLPTVREQFSDATLAQPFTFWPQLAFRATVAAGPNWALLPSAAGIVDPLLSTGFPLNLLGIAKVARILKRGADLEALRAYETEILADLDVAAKLVGALYANMGRFHRFKQLSRLYFAAAIYSETMRRLGRSRQEGFLLRENDSFRAEFAKACALALDGTDDDLALAVEQAIDPIDAGGLMAKGRNSWHPCLLEDLLKAAPKLGAEREALQAIFPKRPGASALAHSSPPRFS